MIVAETVFLDKKRKAKKIKYMKGVEAVTTVAEVWMGCNQVLVTDVSCHKHTEHTNVQQTDRQIKHP